MDVIDIYEEIKEIKVSDYKRISLVLSTVDNLYYIKRELRYYDREVYLQLQRYHCPNIPKIIHIKEKDGVLVVIEEYINASTLDTCISNKEIKETEAVEIIRQLCDCLEFLHTLPRPIIHRDIKPENIFYLHGRAILFDFDIARIYTVGKQKDTVVLGSVGYAAPEQFGFGQSDIRSDIYALGVLFNVLLTNRLPQEYLYTGKYKSIIAKATSLDRKDRYHSVKELKKALNDQYIIIPGFTNPSKRARIVCLLVFICILYFASELKDSTSMSDVYYKIAGFIYIYTIEFLLCNPHLCLFSKSKNILIKIVGMIITYFVVIFMSTVVLLFIESML